MLISNFAYKDFLYNNYCCCLQRYENKLMKIQNEPRIKLPTGIRGEQVC